MSRLLACLCVVFLCVGCQTLKQPDVRVDGASLGKIDADGFTLDLKLNVANPNDRDVSVGKTKYKLALAGQELVKGAVDPDVTIPANGSSVVVVPMTVKFDNFLDLGMAIAQDPTRLRYDVNADLHIGSGFGGASRGFSHRGDVDISEINPVDLLKNRSLRKIGESILRGLTD